MMSRFVRVTRATPGKLDGTGLEPLRMALWDGGRELEHVEAISGARGRQQFRTLANEVRGAFEPCPEGRYYRVGGLEWAGGRGNYNAAWSAALGPVVAEIYGERAIMLHVDGGAIGSAGCLCPRTMASMRRVVAWWEAGKPEWVECDWGLGTVGKPEVAAPGKPVWTKLYRNSNGIQAFRDGEPQAALAVRLDYHSNRLGVAINGVQLPPEQIESVRVEIATRGNQ